MSITVILPVYNGEKYVTQALESILSQTHRPQEIIIIDDGSTDGTAAVAKGFGDTAQYHYQPNQGAGAARNNGVTLAQGDFLAFLDADDLWVEDKLARQRQAFTTDPDLDIVFGHVQQFHSPELPDAVKQQIKIPAEIMSGQHVGAMLIKREAFLTVGLFRIDWEIGEFIDWYARAEELELKRLMLPDVVMKRRLHKASQGTYKRKHQKEYVRVLKAALDRRRKMREVYRNPLANE
jgi:glycosyltransferase involved in cell wall biosynthesis